MNTLKPMKPLKRLAFTLLGLTVFGSAHGQSGMGGRWVTGEMQHVTLDLLQVQGRVSGHAVLGLAWYTTERHFKVTGTADTRAAKLELRQADGQLVYDLRCEDASDQGATDQGATDQGTGAWRCVLFAMSGTEFPASGEAISSARAMMLTLTPAR